MPKPKKQNSMTEFTQRLGQNALENLFYVYKTTEGDYFYNILRTVQIQGLDNLDPTLFSVEEYHQGEQWATISYRNYGTVDLWWTIAKINGYNNPFAMPASGTKILIMKKAVLDQILDTIKIG